MWKLIILFFATTLIFADKVSDYKTFLENLDKKDKYSILLAKDRFISDFKNNELAEKAFLEFNLFYFYAVRKIDNSFLENKKYQQYLENRDKIMKEESDDFFAYIASIENLRNDSTCLELLEFKKCGMRIVDSMEMHWFLCEDRSFLLNEVLKDIKNLLSLYVAGSDNTRISDEKDVVLHENKKSYENFISENTDSKYFEFIKGYYDILKNNKFIVKKELKEYVEKNGFDFHRRFK